MNTIFQAEKLVTGVLCYLLRQNGHMEMCLSERAASDKSLARGLAGKLMGYGGDLIDPEEKHETAAIRKVKHEAGVIVETGGLRKFAEIDFKRPNRSYRCHHFFVDKFQGEPQESAEMLSPRWFSIRNIPYHEMDPSDVRLLPFALSGKKMKGLVEYDETGKVVRVEISFVRDF